MNISLTWLVAAFACAYSLSGCALDSHNQPQHSSPSASELPGFRPAYSTRKFFYVGDPAEAARKHGYDYKAIVSRAAHKDAGALRQLFSMGPECAFDGAASEMHGSVLVEMMLLWGDYDFSRAIHSMSPNMKKSLQARFGGSYDEVTRICFPLTADELFGFRPPGVPKY